MGTNFYVKGHTHTDNPKYHIGKRSAAGWYCWDCKTTLCKQGEEGVHQSNSEWYDKCPFCKKPIEDEGIFNDAVSRELGFNDKPVHRKTGVKSCSSFTWARKLGKIQKIINEYGDEYTREEFLQLLEECPIQRENMIGEWFS